jgi:hypothetical protein
MLWGATQVLLVATTGEEACYFFFARIRSKHEVGKPFQGWLKDLDLAGLRRDNQLLRNYMFFFGLNEKLNSFSLSVVDIKSLG